MNIKNPTMHLRFVKQDGRMVLQQMFYSVEGVSTWENVTQVMSIEDAPKPDTFISPDKGAAPTDTALVDLGNPTGIKEGRASLMARQIRRTMRDYGHKSADTSLPEIIANNLNKVLEAQAIAWPSPPDAPLNSMRSRIAAALRAPTGPKL